MKHAKDLVVGDYVSFYDGMEQVCYGGTFIPVYGDVGTEWVELPHTCHNFTEISHTEDEK